MTRFKRREADPSKSWKINDEDWRNRRKWDEHNAAAEEMFERTSSAAAPWHLIAGNYKWHARLVMLREVIRALDALGPVKSQKKFGKGRAFGVHQRSSG